jgi:hypothetical protein
MKRQIRDFEAAMASKKQQDALSKEKQDHETKAQQTTSLNEPDQRDDCFEDTVSSNEPYPNSRQQDALEPDNSDWQPAEMDETKGYWEQHDLDPNDGYGERTELVEPLPAPELGSKDGVEPTDLGNTDPQPRVDFKRYQDIIEKITVSSNLQDDSKDVNIKFTDETLDGAQVMITKSGDRVKVRWLTDSGSVYRLLTKQRFQLQQHLYGHLGIRSDVSVDFKKESKPRFARQKATDRSSPAQTQKS